MAQSVTNQFQAALTHLLTQEGRGTQSRLAGQQKIDRGYLNAIVKGRKPGSEEVRAKIAGYFNMTYEDMLALGRGILSRSETEISEGKKGGKQKVAAQNDNSQADKRLIDFKSPKKFREAQSGFSEKIMKVVEILESDTIYRDVLAELIDAFYDAVSTKKDNLKLRNQMKEMESRIVSLEKRLADDKDSPRKSA
jgi:transcriptional regulator with XRE-family HTH domain